MANRNDSGLEGCIGCVVLVAAVAAVIGFFVAVLDDTANEPAQYEPERLELEEATVWVTGDDGGAYEVIWRVHTPDGDYFKEGGGTGVIEASPTAYPVDLDGFRSDGNSFALGVEDLDVEASKPEPWEGDLTILLEVNGTIVACATTSDVKTTKHWHKASFWFDADDPEHYEGDLVCRLQRRLF